MPRVGFADPCHEPAPPVRRSWTFESVYREHAKTVARWAMRLLGPHGDFEDVVQDVFLVVMRRLPEFRGEAEVSTWLYEITVRVAQEKRRRSRWWSWVTGRGRHPGRGQICEDFPFLEEPPVDPHARIEARERTRLLYALLDQISEELRTTFILFELEGRPCEEIAKITGASIDTVWVRLHRARKKFLARLRAWEESEQ